jgi:hypothetical protein
MFALLPFHVIRYVMKKKLIVREIQVAERDSKTCWMTRVGYEKQNMGQCAIEEKEQEIIWAS